MRSSTAFMRAAAVRVDRKVSGEPLDGELGDALERARLPERMARMRHDRELARAAQLRVGEPVEAEHRVVFFADDEERGRGHVAERRAGQVRPAAARNDGADALLQARGGDEGRGAPGTRAEISDRSDARFGLREDPVRRALEPGGEEIDVEPQMAGMAIGVLLFGGEQVEEERTEAGLLDDAGDLLVARAVAAAAAAMREEDERAGAVGDGER